MLIDYNGETSFSYATELSAHKAVVRLAGACSNQFSLQTIRKALEARSKLTIKSGTESRRKPIRKKLGVVQDTVLEVLEASTGPLPVAEIQRRTESKLRMTISHHTIHGCLSLAVRKKRFGVVRPRPGVYGLAWKKEID